MATELGAAPAGELRAGPQRRTWRPIRPESEQLRIRTQEIGPCQARPPQIAANVTTDFRSVESPETSHLPKLPHFERPKLRNFRNPETRKKMTQEVAEFQAPRRKKAHLEADPPRIPDTAHPDSGNWRIPSATAPNRGKCRDRLSELRNSETPKLRNYRNSETSKLPKL